MTAKDYGFLFGLVLRAIAIGYIMQYTSGVDFALGIIIWDISDLRYHAWKDRQR